METSRWTLRPDVCRLEHEDGQFISLTPIRTKMLESVARAHGGVARYEFVQELMSEHRNGAGAEGERDLGVHLCKLRKALRAAGVDFEILVDWGVGLHATKKIPIQVDRLSADCCPTCRRPFPVESAA